MFEERQRGDLDQPTSDVRLEPMVKFELRSGSYAPNFTYRSIFIVFGLGLEPMHVHDMENTVRMYNLTEQRPSENLLLSRDTQQMATGGELQTENEQRWDKQKIFKKATQPKVVPHIGGETERLVRDLIHHCGLRALLEPAEAQL